MEALIEFGNKYGPLAILLLLVALNSPRLIGFVEGALAKIWPAVAEYRRSKLERQMNVAEQAARQRRDILEREAAKQERTDTILTLKDMMGLLRQQLTDMNLERQGLQQQFPKLITRYELLTTRVIETLRDVSEVLRSQTKRLDETTTMMRIQNGKDEAGHDKK